MKVVVIGTGYVGLVSGACFAEFGHQVVCVDVNEEKIQQLEQGVIPIYEPGLDAIVEKNIKHNRLTFSTSLADQMNEEAVFFIAVGTPSGEDGSADLQYVLGVAKEIGQNLRCPAVVVDKSTVPVGTADKVTAIIQAELDQRGETIDFGVVSNPEFLKEGKAIEDFLNPDRVVIGADDKRSADIVSALYADAVEPEKIIVMGVRDAEMTKYAANAMLATKISFINEIAVLCDKLGVDVAHVRQGIGSDSRIGFQFINPGCGYGGSCFPKDVKALVKIAEDAQLDSMLLKSVEARNAAQKQVLFQKLKTVVGGDLTGLKVAVWGLAFKPDTDDMREASSLVFINEASMAGANIVAYDPVARETAARELSDNQCLIVDDQYQALQDADVLVILTEWQQFFEPDFDRVKDLMKGRYIIDGRNIYDPAYIAQQGFEYFGIGRKG